MNAQGSIYGIRGECAWIGLLICNDINSYRPIDEYGFGAWLCLISLLFLSSLRWSKKISAFVFLLSLVLAFSWSPSCFLYCTLTKTNSVWSNIKYVRSREILLAYPFPKVHCGSWVWVMCTLIKHFAFSHPHQTYPSYVCMWLWDTVMRSVWCWLISRSKVSSPRSSPG